MSDRLPKFEVQDRIGRITLNDPATFNSLSPAVFARLGEIFAEVRERAHGDIHALLLTGTGKAFCAGAELGSMARMDGDDGLTTGQRISKWTWEDGTPVVMAWSDPPVPMVTAINGVTAGIGMSLALSSDVVIAARSAVFKIPFFTGLGLVPDGGLTWQLPRLIGAARTSAMALLGDKVSAQQAADWGMIWRCVEDAELMAEAESIAQRLARLPHYAAREMRAALALSMKNDFAGHYRYELERNTELLNGEEFAEGLRAFFEKREPQFRK